MPGRQIVTCDDDRYPFSIGIAAHVEHDRDQGQDGCENPAGQGTVEPWWSIPEGFPKAFPTAEVGCAPSTRTAIAANA